MESINYCFLKILRKVYHQFLQPQKGTVTPNEVGLSAEETSDIILKYITSNAPCMIARFGSTELAAVLNSIAVTQKKRNPWAYIKGKQSQWWWNKTLLNQMEQWSGFFPSTPDNVTKFSELMLSSIQQLDVLARWTRNDENIEIPQSVKRIHLAFLEPYWSKNPWTRALAGKKILVIHPYAELIEHQYLCKRNTLFKDANVLPQFSLSTIKAVQSLGGSCDNFSNWFDALEWMKKEIDKKDFDVCLVGCGAYGFILAAYIKQIGKKAIHIGGALQLLFGIKGKRWENPDYLKEWQLSPRNFYLELFNNPSWVRPSEYKPQNAENVENGCYW